MPAELPRSHDRGGTATAFLEPEDIREAYRLGAYSYVVKPVDFARFPSIVAQIGRYWLSLNEPADVNARY